MALATAAAASGISDDTTHSSKQQAYYEQKEQQNLHRVFVAMDQNGDGLVDSRELTEVLSRLDYKAKKAEALRTHPFTLCTVPKLLSCAQVEDMIWEVDEDCDKCVSWQEFKLMFERCSGDKVVEPATPTTHEPGSLDERRSTRRAWSQGGCSTLWSS